jgi:hypothetical protein
LLKQTFADVERKYAPAMAKADGNIDAIVVAVLTLKRRVPLPSAFRKL